MSKIMNGMEYHPVSAAAERLATTEMKVLMLLKRKALTGGLIDGAWFVTAESLAEYQPGAENSAEGLTCRSICGNSACGCR